MQMVYAGQEPEREHYAQTEEWPMADAGCTVAKVLAPKLRKDVSELRGQDGSMASTQGKDVGSGVFSELIC
jgi:hypothetical protein